MSAESPRHARSGGPLTVPAQPPPDRTIIDAVSGFINDVKLTSSSTVDPKDVIQWARFETADINEPTPEGDGDNEEPPLLLVLGYGAGVQVWLIPPNGEAQEVLSWRQGTVRVLRILPTPDKGDCFAPKRPLIALCDSASPGPPFCSLSFISIRGGEQVKSIKFKNPILDVLANKRSVVVSFPERFAVFAAGSLEDRVSVTSCFPCPCPRGGPPANPLALGQRWIAYADSNLNVSKRSSGGCEGEGVSSYTAAVLHAAKSLGRGLRGLGESVAHSLGGARPAAPAGPAARAAPGLVTVMDAAGPPDDGADGDEPYEPMVAHFMAHSEPITALQFDASGLLLVTADRRGHDFHVFRINPHPCGPGLASVHHLYILHRGDTTAKVQDISISGDGRWVAVSTLRGTTHVFAVCPYGGAAALRTHSQPRVVNRVSRFQRSAGLHEARPQPADAWFPNPRLPPYPAPVRSPALAQLRPTPNLATHTVTRTSAGRQRLASLSEDAAPLLARACWGAPAAAANRAEQALYLLAAGGTLAHLVLHPRAASNIPKEKLCDESPIEVVVEGVSQWSLRRSPSSADVLAPLPPASPLLQPPAPLRCADMCMSEEERWLSQVEIVTHAGPHRRLWMGPQFVFKTYNSGGGGGRGGWECEAVEVELGGGAARSNPVNVPPHGAVLVGSGSASSLEHSPSDSFRRKSMLSESGRPSVCDVQLKEDLAEAMKEDHGPRRRSGERGESADGPRAGGPRASGPARAVGPGGTVVAAARGPAAPPAADPSPTDNVDEAVFRCVVRASAAPPPHLPARALPRTTTIPVQALHAAPPARWDQAWDLELGGVPRAPAAPAPPAPPGPTGGGLRGASTDTPGDPPTEEPTEVPHTNQKDAPKQLPIETPKEITKEISKEKPKQPPQETLKEASKETPKMMPKETPKETLKEIPKETLKEMPKETPKDIPKEIPKQMSKETPKETIKPSKESMADESSKNTTKRTSKTESMRRNRDKDADIPETTIPPKREPEAKPTAKTEKPLNAASISVKESAKSVHIAESVETKFTVNRKSKERDLSKEGVKPKEREQSKDRVKSKERERSKDRVKSKERERSKDRVKSKERESSKDRVKCKERESSKDRVKCKEREKSKETDVVTVKEITDVRSKKEASEERLTLKEPEVKLPSRRESKEREISPRKEIEIPKGPWKKDAPESAWTVKKDLFPTKSERLSVSPKKEVVEVEPVIKTEDQAWDMLLNEPDKPILSVTVTEEKPKVKKNRKIKKIQDDPQNKSEDDSFVEIHAIEESADNQLGSDDLVSISMPYDEFSPPGTYSSKMKKSKSPKPFEKKEESDAKLDDWTLESIDVAVKIKSSRKKSDVPEVITLPETDTKQKAKEKRDKVLELKDDTVEVLLEATTPIVEKKNRYEHRKSIEKDTDVKDVYVIDSTKDEFPEIQITRGNKSRKKSPLLDRKIDDVEIAVEKPAIKSWSSIAACKNSKKVEVKEVTKKIEVQGSSEVLDKVEKEIPKLEAIVSQHYATKLAQPATPSTNVSLQEELMRLCKRTDIMVAECDAPSDSKSDDSLIQDLPPLELDFGLDHFKLEVMRDCLLESTETKITSPICKIDIDNILSTIKESTSAFNLIDLEKVPDKKEKGFSVIQSDKIKSQEVKVDDDVKSEEKDAEVMEKSSDDDNNSPVLSTDSDKDDKKSSGASNVTMPSPKQSSKSKKSRRKKK